MFKPRDYQEKGSTEGAKQCLERGWCYLAYEVRTGKSLTSIMIASKIKAKKILFVTKKKAINSVESDIKLFNDNSMDFTVINYESLHKIKDNYDFFIIDEAHRLGGFPKPSKATKQLKSIVKNNKVIFLSGTPTPESYAQIYHQLFILNDNNPFKKYKNFYEFAKTNCNIKEKRFGHGFPVKDYSDCQFDINKLKFLSYSQKEAGFKNVINEHFINVEMNQTTKKIIKTLRKDKIFEGNNNYILADTPVKEMQKIHQLSSGTCILDKDNKSIIIDESKIKYIKDNFKNKKIAIFYKFKKEYDLIKKHLNITNNLNEFNQTDKSIALQFVSGREGIKLNKADCIVAFNIDFSATTYFQFRDRMTTIDRIESDVYYIISDCGIEMDVYKAVCNKKNFTQKYYVRTGLSKKNY